MLDNAIRKPVGQCPYLNSTFSLQRSVQHVARCTVARAFINSLKLRKASAQHFNNAGSMRGKACAKLLKNP